MSQRYEVKHTNASLEALRKYIILESNHLLSLNSPLRIDAGEVGYLLHRSLSVLRPQTIQAPAQTPGSVQLHSFHPEIYHSLPQAHPSLIHHCHIPQRTFI